MALRFSPARGAASLVLNSMVRGPQGPAATVEIGSVQTIDPGQDPTVVNSGTSGAAILNFQIPTSKTVAVNSTATSKAGTSATVVDSGTATETSLDFTIPRGADAGHKFTFDTSTTMAAPSSGGVRFNNATPASITQIAISATDADGNPVRPYMLTWDDSTNTAKGAIIFKKEATGTAIVLLINGAITDNTTWLQIPVTHSSGTTLFSASDPVYARPDITGNKGADGAGDFNSNTATSVDGEAVVFSGTGGKTGRRFTLSGMIKAASGVLSAATAGTDYMKPDTTSALTAGFTSASVSAGTKSSGTYTFDPTAGAVQHATNGGAHTFAPPATHGAWMLDYVNNASAGAITTSGWTKVDGDAFDTTNGHAFRCMLSVGNQGSWLNVKRMV